MADYDPFGEQESRSDKPTGEDIPLIPGKGGVSTWTPGRIQETSFGGVRTTIVQDYVKDLLKKLSGSIVVTPEAFHSLYFKIEDGELYYKVTPKPLMKEGVLLSAGDIANILGKSILCKLGFNIPKGEITPQEFIMMNIAEKNMPSASDIANADDTELPEIVKKKTSRSMEDLITNMKDSQSQTDESIKNSCELSGLDKELMKTRGQLKVVVSKKLDLEEKIKEEKEKLNDIENPMRYIDVDSKEIRNRIKNLNDEL